MPRRYPRRPSIERLGSLDAYVGRYGRAHDHDGVEAHIHPIVRDGDIPLAHLICLQNGLVSFSQGHP